MSVQKTNPFEYQPPYSDMPYPNIPYPNIPYPGTAAEFYHHAGDWEYFDVSSTSICRQMTFYSRTPDAIIRHIDLRELKNGKVEIMVIFFSNTCEKAKEYFSRFGVILNFEHATQFPSSYGESYQSKNLTELKLIFKIIIENNRFPGTHLDKIKNIISNAKEY